MSCNGKILLVDDDEAFLEANSVLLEREGFQVITATDGKSGLAACRKHRPDLAVLDIIMGRPDEGFALARAIRKDPACQGTKLLVISAVGQRYEMLFEPDDQWLPVDKVLEKPVPPEEMLAVVTALIRESEGAEKAS